MWKTITQMPGLGVTHINTKCSAWRAAGGGGRDENHLLRVFKCQVPAQWDGGEGTSSLEARERSFPYLGLRCPICRMGDWGRADF